MQTRCAEGFDFLEVNARVIITALKMTVRRDFTYPILDSIPLIASGGAFRKIRFHHSQLVSSYIVHRAHEHYRSK